MSIFIFYLPPQGFVSFSKHLFLPDNKLNTSHYKYVQRNMHQRTVEESKGIYVSDFRLPCFEDQKAHQA